MSENTSTHTDHSQDLWWRQLGLSDSSGPGSSGNQRRLQSARSDYLRSLRPSGFTRATAEGDAVLTVEQVAAELDAIDQANTVAVQNEAHQRGERGWVHVRRALSASDADVPVERGDWAGFTRGHAIAWCWNLYQYEPRGFVHPASQLRAERTSELEAGMIPDGFGYAQRAADLEAAGFTPETYRRAQEALGKSTFSPADVTH
ncbi:hypothetical protein ACSS7Z_01255 [Microbacterium sp. A82]|uniref:hypothetical protein n=1 Tax=Microbacterium sp. A82 TaxID=3450452 RepID=UPI003F2BE8D8